MKILFDMIIGIFGFAFKLAIIAIILMVLAVACGVTVVSNTIDDAQKTYNASTQ